MFPIGDAIFHAHILIRFRKGRMSYHRIYRTWYNQYISNRMLAFFAHVLQDDRKHIGIRNLFRHIPMETGLANRFYGVFELYEDFLSPFHTERTYGYRPPRRAVDNHTNSFSYSLCGCTS